MVRNTIPLALILTLGILPASLSAWTLDAEPEGEALLLHWSMTEQPREVALAGDSWLQLDLEALQPLPDLGVPSLPYLSRLVEVQPGHGLQVELLNPVWETLAGKPLPQQDVMRDAHSLPAAWHVDANSYQSGSVFPEEVLSSGGEAVIRGGSFSRISLIPARFDSGSNQMSLLREATIRVTQVVDASAPVSIRPDVSPLAGLVPESATVRFPRTGVIRDAIEPLPGAYLVLARNSTVQNNSYLQAWLDWKRDKGHSIVTAGETEVGSWTASSIRSYIQSAYANWEEAPAYVLLVGDPSGSSSYYLPTNGTGYSGEYDHAYACVDGGDVLADLSVGRLSVENATQLGTICNKLLYYETTPTVAGSDWLEGAGLTTGWNAISMIQQSRTIVSDMVEQGITDVDTLWYPSSDAGDVNGWFNQGIALYNYRGWIGMDGMSNSFIDNESNFINYGMPPIVAVFTCSTGDFNYTCETEAFMRKGDVSTPRGAAAAMGFATSNTHTAYNNAVAGGFWSTFLDLGVTQVGPCMFAGKATLVLNLPPGDANAGRYSNWANLMGDPGMDMWCGVPDQLQVTLAGGSTISLGTAGVEANVLADGQPVAGVTVCLRQGTFMSRGLTDDSGTVLLAVDGASAGTVALTASKPDFLPDRESINISSGTFAELVDWQPSGDGIVSPGEIVTLAPRIQNAGTSSLSSLSTTLVALDDGVTVLDNSASWASTIAPGGQATASNSLQIQVDADRTDLHSASFSLTYTSAQGSFSDICRLELAQPVFQVSGLGFTPGGSLLVPGQSSSMSLQLENLGTLDANAINFTLSAPGDAFLTVLDATDTGSIPVGGSQAVEFVVDVDALAVRGHEVPFTLNWSGLGMSGQLGFTASISVPVTNGPTGPDAYGYRAIEDVDANTEAPGYQWVEIATPAGGNGTNLNLSDYGDQQDDAATINLPFDVVYYGIAYSEVAVCSNGFLAFEPGAVSQTDFRNHHLPSGLGPDAMVAVAWDDHTLSGGGGVYWKHDAANHRVIIEWYHMQHNGSGGTNTFQAILHDPEFHSTPTGDSPILLQYQVWNNTQSNSYDFPGCSVGIKDETSSRGLNLTNYQLNDPTIAGFNSGKAILITTEEGSFQPGTDTTPPTIVVTAISAVQPNEQPWISAAVTDISGVGYAELTWRLNGGTWQTDYMTWTSGDQFVIQLPAQVIGSVVQYYVRAEDLAIPANTTTSPTYSYTVISGNPPTGPNAYGYRIYDAGDALEGPSYLWIDISSQGSPVSVGDDQTATVNLPAGFDAVFYGQSFSQVSICSNGFVSMGSNSYSGYSNSSLGNGNGSDFMICPLWDDLNPNSGGQIRAADLGDGRFVISWIDIAHYGSSTTERFQLVIHDALQFPTDRGNSPLLIQYADVGTVGSCTVGIQDGSSNDGLQYLYNGSYGQDASTIVDGQALWITTGAIPLIPVDDLSISYQGGSLELSWSDTGAPAYAVYAGSDAYGSIGELVQQVAGTSLVIGAGQAMRFFEVRSSSVPVATRGSWSPEIHLHEETFKTTSPQEN